MTFRQDLKTFLDADTGLFAIVGNRIHPVVGTSKEATPYITFSTISNPGMFHTLGVTELTRETIQFSCWGKNATEAYLAGEQLRKTLNGFYGNMINTFVQGIFLKNESDSDIKPTDGSQKYYISRILVFDFTYEVIADPTAPSFISNPTITGGNKVGDTSTMVDGVVTGKPMPSITRGWKRDNVVIAGATDSTYTKVAADLGTNTKGFNTATNSEGSAEADSNEIYVGSSPVFDTQPTIAGSGIIGEDITAVDGTSSGDPTPTVTFEFTVNGVPNGVTATIYTLQAGDLGKQIGRRNTADNGIDPVAIANSNTIEVVIGYTGPLDIDPINGVYAYASARALSKDYVGNIFQVRRQSDSVLLDIGVVDFYADTESYFDHVGSENGWLQTYYNQLGGTNAVQLDINDQQRLSPLNIGGKLSAKTTGTAWYDITGIVDGSSSHTFYFVVNLQSTVSIWLADFLSGRIIPIADSADTYQYYDGGFKDSGVPTVLDSPQLLTFVFNDITGTAQIRKDGLEIFSGPYSSKALGGAAGLFSSSTGSNSLKGSSTEALLFSVAHDAQMLSDQESNIMGAYGIGQQEDNKDIFIVAGQSNAQGNGTGGPAVPFDVGYEFTAIGGIDNTHPINDPVGNANVGSAWPSFCIKYKELTNRIAMIIPVAVAGSGLSETSNSGNNWAGENSSPIYPVMLVRGDTAETAYRQDVKGILWAQGVQDANTMNVNPAYTKPIVQGYQDLVMDNFHSDFPSAKFIISEVGNIDQPNVTQGDTDMRDIQSTSVSTRAWSSFGWLGAKDGTWTGIHYDQAGLNDMGENLAIEAAFQIHGVPK